MKLKNNFFYTIREDVRDEESTSGKLLVRSGMIKKNSNSIPGSSFRCWLAGRL